jgi:hypothetical protein
LLSTRYSVSVIRHICLHCQQRLASLFGDAQSEGSDEHAAQLNTTALEMAFDEFCETLAAMAIFVQPDPYLSLAHRLGNFLAADLLPALQVQTRERVFACGLRWVVFPVDLLFFSHGWGSITRVPAQSIWRSYCRCNSID